MSGKKGRKRIVPRDWELMDLDNVDVDDDGEDADFKPSTDVPGSIWESADDDSDDDDDDNGADSGGDQN